LSGIHSGIHLDTNLPVPHFMSSNVDENAIAVQIVGLERAALNRWGSGDPGGFLELYAPDITYFDPGTAARIDGHEAMAAYYAPWVGKIQIVRYEMLNPHVVVSGAMALLTYNLVNYINDANGAEVVGSEWNSTVVFRRVGNSWRSIHSHWSFTRHAAFQSVTPESAEGLGA
jgi:ketosteroid isomerase-like protein